MATENMIDEADRVYTRAGQRRRMRGINGEEPLLAMPRAFDPYAGEFHSRWERELLDIRPYGRVYPVKRCSAPWNNGA